MSIIPRPRDEIRESILASWRAAFAPRRIVTAPKSFLWSLADALALEQEGAEATAAAGVLEAFPQTASEDGVLKHADWSGLIRVPATRAMLRARVTGTPSATVTIAEGSELTSVEGLLFEAYPGPLTLDGAGLGYLPVLARDAGAAGTLSSGAELTWQGAPAGLTATAVCEAAPGDVSHVLIPGADLETIEALRTRVELWRKEKAQGGNRADWMLWATSVTGVGSAYVYPRARRVSDGLGGWTWSYAVPGGVVVLPLAPAPAPPAASYVQNADGSMGLGLDPAFTRIPSDVLRARIEGFIEGTSDVDGRPVPEALRKQLRPAGMAPGNYEAGAAETASADFELRLTVDPAVAPWPWGQTNASVRNVVSSTSNTLSLDNVTGISAGSRLAVYLGTNIVRGGWWLAQVQGAPVGNVVTLTTALPAEPSVGADVRPDCGFWSEVRRRVLEKVDALGTGDAQVPNDGTYPDPVVAQIMSARYPRPSDTGRDRIFVSDVIGWLDSIPGLVAIEVTTPGGTLIAAPGELITPGRIEIWIGA